MKKKIQTSTNSPKKVTSALREAGTYSYKIYTNNCIYNPNLVCINKIPKRFHCAQSLAQETRNNMQ